MTNEEEALIIKLQDRITELEAELELSQVDEPTHYVSMSNYTFQAFYKLLHPEWPEARGSDVDSAIWMNSLDS
jgi:hypothetical protein